VGDRIGDRLGKLALQSGSGAEMVEEIGVGPADLGRDRLERDRLRSLFEQQLPGGRESDGAAFFRAKAGSSY
jgi:hypothetical protein